MIIGLVSAALAADLPYQGRLHDALGAPLSADVELDIQLIDAGGSDVYTLDAGTVTLADGYFNVTLTPSDSELALATAVRVLVDGQTMTPDTPLADVPSAQSLDGQTLTQLDQRFRPGIATVSWDDDGTASAGNTPFVNGPVCTSKSLSPQQTGNYLVQARWTVYTADTGACRYISCRLLHNGTPVGETYNADDNLQSMNADVGTTYRTGYVDGVIAMGAASSNTFQWTCQKASNCGLALQMQCDRSQVIVQGPYGDL